MAKRMAKLTHQQIAAAVTFDASQSQLLCPVCHSAGARHTMQQLHATALYCQWCHTEVHLEAQGGPAAREDG